MGVASLFIPYTRIGELLVTIEGLALANIALKVAQGIEGNREAWDSIFSEYILGLLYELKLKTIMPGWAKSAFEAKGVASVLYTAMDNPTRDWAIPERVPADAILDQIYRFRCLVHPSLPKQIESAIKNDQKLLALFLACR